MDALPTDYFPSDLKTAATSHFKIPSLAAVLLRQLPTEPCRSFPSCGQTFLGKLLHPKEIEKAAGFRFVKRRSEFLTGRVCAKMALQTFWSSLETGRCPQLNTVDIVNEPSGRPIVSCNGLWTDPPPEISITHSGGYAAALAAGFLCGIDLQEQKDNLLRVEEKYCSQTELQLMTKFLPKNSIKSYLSLLWAAKEAAKKALSSLQMPGFLELLLTPPIGSVADCHVFRLTVRIQDNILMPQEVTALATTFENYSLAMCIVKKEEYA